MAARQIVALPNHLPRLRVQTRRPEAAEMDVNPSWFDYRRRCCVTVHGSAIAEWLRHVAVEDGFVEENLAGFGIHADGIKIMAIDCRRGHPDLAAHHHRCGPTAMG